MRRSQHEAFEHAAAQLRPAWAHVWAAATPDAHGRAPASVEETAREATLDFSFAAHDQREVDRYLTSLQRDFRAQKPRLLRWVAVLALTGVGLLWGLSTTAASDPRPSATPAAP